MNIACAVLAAGASRRLGAPKQLLPLRGRPLIAHIVEAACASVAAQVAVVLGAHADEIAPAFAGTRAQSLHNPRWPSGMASSLHTAVYWAQRSGAEALLLCACDQPLLTSAHLDALCALQRTAASLYRDALGVPALVEARHFERLLAIEGDRGAAPLLRSGIEVAAVPWPDGALDLDTAEDVARFNSRA